MAKNNGSSKYEHFYRPSVISNEYPYAYNFYLIDSIERLKAVMEDSYRDPMNIIAFDTETTGLNQDECTLVGYSFCYNGVDAYYVPVSHSPFRDTIRTEISREEYELHCKEDNYFGDYDNNKFYVDIQTEEKDMSLGDEAVEIFYQRMLKASLVLMFNCRFDIRVFEKYGFIENNVPYEERDRRLYYKYDMSKVHFFDVQALIYLTDTNIAYPSLKKSEQYFLGWRGAGFEETLGNAVSFYYLKPTECYLYAATDALGTFLLFFCEPAQQMIQEVQQFTRYPKQYYGLRNSLELDNDFLYPLMLMEDEKTFVDVDLLKKYSEYYDKEIRRIENEIYQYAGRVFNISSPKQKAEVFKEKGIVTVEYDKTPAVSEKTGLILADKVHINITIEKLGLSPDDPKRIFMENLIKYANLAKQKGTYTDTYIKMATESHYNQRLRFSYKTITVPSGRLAAGGDKKNSYFADSNIQNLPKPHMGNVYYVRYDEAIKVVPELEGAYENDYQEYEYNGEHTYKILSWIFKETVWNLGIEEKKVEGFFQDLNMRSALCADKDKYWVSCDYSAQELRIPALLTHEPLWTETFANDGDLHKVMAKKIWGEENYTKSKRKQAKAVNFGILYGKTAHNFSNDLDISIEEAEKLVDDYKKTASTLFRWVADNEEIARKTGSTHTMFGRPRRLRWYFRSDQPRSMIQFGLRSATNTVIQGTGADILKMAFLKIYDTFFNGKQVDRNKVREQVKFINTVHDEINYNVSRKNVEKLVPCIIGCMRFWFPFWKFPMKVGLDIGCRWGQTVTFNYDDKSHIELTDEDKLNPNIKRFRKLTPEEQEQRQRFGPASFELDPNGEYKVNPNYLHILEPAGEPLDESDYKVKETKVDVSNIEEEKNDEEKIFDDIMTEV